VVEIFGEIVKRQVCPKRGVSCRRLTHTLEKCFENHHFIFCSPFQNLRLGGVNFAKNVKKESMPEHGIRDWCPSWSENGFSCPHELKNRWFRALEHALRFARWLQKESMHCEQTPKSSNQDFSFWHPNGVSCPYEHLEIGDFGVWLRCYLFVTTLCSPNEDFGRPTPTPGRANLRESILKALFTYVSTLFGLRFGPSKNMWVLHFVSTFHHFQSK